MNELEKIILIKSRVRRFILQSEWDANGVVDIKNTIYIYGLHPLSRKSLYLPYIFERYLLTFKR